MKVDHYYQKNLLNGITFMFSVLKVDFVFTCSQIQDLKAGTERWNITSMADPVNWKD